MCMKPVVIQAEDDEISEQVLLPCRPGVEPHRSIYLILQGNGADAHYIGACFNTTEITADSEEVSPMFENLHDLRNNSSTISSDSDSNIRVEPSAETSISSNGMTYPSTAISKRKVFFT